MEAKAYFSKTLSKINATTTPTKPAPELQSDDFEDVKTIDLEIKDEWGANSIILGMSGSGKTSFIARLIHDNAQIWSYGFVFSNSGSYCKKNYDYMPKGTIYGHFDVDIIKKIQKLQKSLVVQGINNHCFLVLDDVMSENFHTSKNRLWWANLLSTSRQLNISIFIGLHDLTGISPKMRSQLSHIFMLTCAQNFDILRTLTGSSLDKNEFYALTTQASRIPWACLWFKKRAYVEKEYTLFKRKPHKKFKLVFTKPKEINEHSQEEKKLPESPGQNSDISRQSLSDTDEDE